ncbi:MAG: S41 family peptidase [Candidatus Omnitrophota bacterium]|nr:S41 family peptidase [Candidatus Omnitrophota bacterium]
MRKMKISAIIFIAAAGAVFFSYNAFCAMDKKKSELYRQVGLFSDALALIQTDYIDEVKSQDLIYGALKGMLGSLDAHSQFMDPETYNELKVSTEGKFGGIGIEITISDGLLTVVTPIEDTPAWKAGLKANDRIIKINNEITRDMTLTEAVKRLRGKPSEAVNVTILRESEKKIIDFKIIRDIIKIKDIKEAKILEDGIGYIRLVEFSEHTAIDIDQVLKKLSKEGLKGLILDLRNNPGGLLDVAVKVTERFVEKGKIIVYTKGRQGKQDFQFKAEYSKPWLNIPIAILINEGSASGSEIVAGSLQDHKKAIIIGVKSFGKGSVQTIIPLGDGSALRLTTSKYYTPLGRQIHEKGIIPDIIVEEGKIELVQNNKGAIEETEDVFEKIDTAVKKPAEDNKYKTDNQLVRAVDVLKGILFYSRVKNTLPK